MDILNYCKNCAYNQKGNCILHGEPVSDKDFCSKWSHMLHFCDGCHRPLTPNAVVIVPDNDNKTLHMFCSQCANTFCITGKDNNG